MDPVCGAVGTVFPSESGGRRGGTFEQSVLSVCGSKRTHLRGIYYNQRSQRIQPVSSIHTARIKSADLKV